MFLYSIELLKVALCELIQWDFSDLRDDVLVDPILIAELRVEPKLGLTVVLIPKIQPVTEGHVRLAPGHRRRIFFFQFSLFIAVQFTQAEMT